jgi:adenine-specific DNA methylase
LNKRVIEWKIPLVEISKASRHEKSVRHGHPSTLHLWWARRPLASSRATTFAALIDLPTSSQERQEINQLLKDFSPWNAVKEGLSPVIRQAQQILREKWDKTPPKVIDPFSGGGSIPLEALRLGCETYACDLNPVAVLIGKATLEWPQKIANPDLANYVERWAKKINDIAKIEIGQFYPSDSDGKVPIGYLWARIIECSNPACMAEIPLIKHFWLARKKNRSIAYKPIINVQQKIISFQIQENQEIDFDPSIGTISHGRARCLICNQVVLAVKIREKAQQGKMQQRMTVVILRSPNRKNKFYRVANDQDVIIFNHASSYLSQELEKAEVIESLLPTEDLPPPGTLGFSVQNYGMTLETY